MKKMRQSGQEKTKKVVVKVVEGIKDGADKLLKGLKITGAFTLGGTAIANANTNAEEIIANLDAPQKVQTTNDDKTKKVANFKEKKDPKITSLDYLGAGDPPLKIGHITIDEKDMVTSFVDQLGMRDMTARRFASIIQKIRNSKYQAQYIKVIEVIDGFVSNKKLSAKQGWALLLYITDDIAFNQMFEPGDKMYKLFKDGLARDKDVKAFYKAGNQNGYIMTGGVFNPNSFNKLLVYAANMETRSGYSANVETADDFDPFATDFADDALEESQKGVEESQKGVEESQKGVEESQKGVEESHKQLQAELDRKKELLNDINKTDEEIKQIKKEIAEIEAKIAGNN